MTEPRSDAAVEVFVSYSHVDEALCKDLTKHLRPLEREGVIRLWIDRQMTPGQEFDPEIAASLSRAKIILLLISPGFIDSEYCWDIEMTEALKRHENHDACVIPVILCPVDWHRTPFGKLTALPEDGRPVTTWANRDMALVDVARGVRAAAAKFDPSRDHIGRLTGGPNDQSPNTAARIDGRTPVNNVRKPFLTVALLGVLTFVTPRLANTYALVQQRDINTAATERYQATLLVLLILWIAILVLVFVSGAVLARRGTFGYRSSLRWAFAFAILAGLSILFGHMNYSHYEGISAVDPSAPALAWPQYLAGAYLLASIWNVTSAYLDAIGERSSSSISVK